MHVPTIIIPETLSETLVWISVKNRMTNPEAISKCSKCDKECIIHPNYTKAGISACVPKCNTVYDTCKRLIEFRKWTFISAEKNTRAKETTVHFCCDKNHTMTLTFEALRKGAGCKSCISISRTKPNQEKKKLIRAICECKGKSKDKVRKPTVCPHHNHLVCYPDSASEWDYEKNGDKRPEQVSPSPKTHYWWKCPHEWCKMSYYQRTDARAADNFRCPYCSHNEVCLWNCVLTTHPELCKELDPDNLTKPTEMTYGSSTIVGWICNKHKLDDNDLPFKYSTPLCQRTGKSQSGCPKCNQLGYDQKVGGHEHFVKVANEIHGNKYQYLDEYKGNQVHVTIYCPKIRPFSPYSTNGIPHGNFIQTPDRHKVSTYGCPKCFEEATESSYVKALNELLLSMGYEHDINLFSEIKFPGMENIFQLSTDTYINKLLENLAMEVDGGQHFKVSESWGGEEALEKTQERDVMKDLYCLNNKINLLRIPHTLKISKATLEAIIKICRSGRQVYVTYPHYFEITSKQVDMSNIWVYLIPAPKK